MGVKLLRSSAIQPQSGTQSGSSVSLCLRRRPILPPFLLGHLSLDTPSSGRASPSIRTLVCHCEAISFSILSPAIRLIPPCFSIYERDDIPLGSSLSFEGRFPSIVFALEAFDASTPLCPASPSKIGGSPPARSPTFSPRTATSEPHGYGLPRQEVQEKRSDNTR